MSENHNLHLVFSTFLDRKPGFCTQRLEPCDNAVLHAMLTEDGVELNGDTNPDLPARHKRPVFTAVWGNISGDEDILKYLIWMGSDLVSPSYSEAANECESSSTSAYSPNRKCYNNTLTPLMYGQA